MYLVCVDSLVHCPCGHEEVNRSGSKVCWQLVQFTKLLHVVDYRVVLCCVFLRLLKYSRDLAENEGEQDC